MKLKLKKPVVLTGFWGIGKSTLGKSLADQLGTPFVDLDQWLERKSGVPLNSMIRDRGATVFRAIESQAMELHLALRPYAVVALGGGSLIRDINVHKMKSKSFSIYLQADLREHWKRLDHIPGIHQRAFMPRPCRSARDLEPAFKVREPGYASADVTLNVQDRTPDEIIEELIDILLQQNLFMWDEESLWMAN